MESEMENWWMIPRKQSKDSDALIKNPQYFMATKRPYEHGPANDRLKRLQDNHKRKQHLVDPGISKNKKLEAARQAKQSASLNSNKASNESTSLVTTSRTLSKASDSSPLAKKASNYGTKSSTNTSGSSLLPNKASNVETKESELDRKLAQAIYTYITHKVPQKAKCAQKPATAPIPAAQSTIRVRTRKVPMKKSVLTKPAALTASSALAVKESVKKLKEQQQRKAENRLPTFTASYPSKNEDNFQISVQHEGGANKRLEKLRQTLEKQQAKGSSSSVDVHSSSGTTSEVARAVFAAPFESSRTSTATDEVEPMDWEPIEEDCSVHEVPNVSVSSPNNNSVEFRNSCETRAGYYDTLRNNLLRITASKPMTQDWLPDHLYCVIDTNVLIDQLTFIEDLKQIQLRASNGCVVFVPYVVLQELDKLKVRGRNESTKIRAQRAIKYLNRQLEAKVDNVRAQSAMQDKKRSIDVPSADDSIINCCLQVKQHVASVVLLSEDVNLRSKALVSGIEVTTKSGLVKTNWLSFRPNKFKF